jgi:hypothetical protein
VPETQPSALTQLSKKLELSSTEDSSSSESSASAANTQTGEPLRSDPITRPSQSKASQLSQEAAAAETKNKSKGKGKGRKVRETVPTSQLLEEFSIV